VLAALLTIVLWKPLCLLQAQAQSVSADTGLSGWSADQSALDTLVDLGYRDKIPMGIVIEGDALCTHQLSASSSSSSIGELISNISGQIPGYMGELNDGVLFIHPISSEPGTATALDFMIPRFSTPDSSSAQELGINLWMGIRALLVPAEGSAFAGGGIYRKELIPPIDISNASVRMILDLIVAKGQHGLWTMHTVPATWQKTPNTNPFWFYMYSDVRQSAKEVSCEVGGRKTPQ
jgi:hypothetical protein